MPSVIHLNQRLIALGLGSGPSKKLMEMGFDDHYKRSDPSVFEGVKKKVCFLFMSRSGSTFLMEKLNQTGLVGTVMEHMNAYKMIEGKEKWGVKSTKEYIRKTVETSKTDNGVFAFKGHLEGLAPLAQIGELPDNIKDWTSVTIYRRDIVAQTISLSRAKATGVWHDRGGAKSANVGFPGEATHMKELKRNYNIILRKQGAIERFMLLHGIKPLQLCYEDFCDDQVVPYIRFLITSGSHHRTILMTLQRTEITKSCASQRLNTLQSSSSVDFDHVPRGSQIRAKSGLTQGIVSSVVTMSSIRLVRSLPITPSPNP